MYRRLAFLCLALSLAPIARAQELHAHRTALTAWLDLRNTRPDAQTVPAWVEGLEYRGSRQTAAGARSVFRVRLTRPAAATDDLQIRLLFDDRPGQYGPEVTAWDELGAEVIRSGPLGQGLDLPSSDTVTFPMDGVNYLEIEAPADGSSVRGVFLTWLTKTEIRQAADFPSGETIRQPFHILAPRHTSKDDAFLFGVVTAALQTDPLLLKAPATASAAFQFDLERQPLVAVLTYEALGATIDAPPDVAINGHPLGASSLSLPDLADPAFQGLARTLDPQMAFRYTGWVRGQKVIPGNLLKGGLNSLALQLSNGSESVAIRTVEIQLKYNWEKLDYLLSSQPATPSP